jgi:type IV secretion system protein VirB10
MTRSDEETPPLPQPKADPESLVLREKPRPVARFRRGVVIGGVAAMSASLIALTWLALEPVTFRTVAGDPGGRPFEHSSPEAVQGAPRDYRDVPQLGPPLPGDLGRPILEHQREQDGRPLESGSQSADTAAERAGTLREQRAAAEQAARASSVVVQLPGVRQPGVPDGAALPQPPAEAQPTAPAPSAAAKVQLGDWGRSDANPHEVTAPMSRWVIAAGSVIPASLLIGLNSDLPGMVLAQVTENVRDSITGRAVLIPQGARLIGRYDSNVSYGQKRAFVVWQRILFPDGSSLRLDNMPAGDAAGYAGLADRVDGHSWQLMKGVILSTLLGVGGQLSLGNDRGILRALRQSAQENASQAGGQIVSRGLDIQPTIRVRPGWPVRVLVSEDLVLQPWKG